MTLSYRSGTASTTFLSGNILYVDAESSSSENLLLPPEVDADGSQVWIINTGGETINVQTDAGGAIATVATGSFGSFWCNGTTWFGLGLTDGQILVADTQLTHTQIINLAATSIELVPLPGADRAAIPFRALLVADTTAAAYTAGMGDDLRIRAAPGGVSWISPIETDVLLATSGVQNINQSVAEIQPSSTGNTGLELTNIGSELGAGNAANTLSVRVWYSIIDTVPFS